MEVIFVFFKKKINLQINRDLMIKEKFDWNFDDCVDVELFVDQLISILDIENVDSKEICNQIYYQLIDHIEKFTVRYRMTKEEKHKKDKF